MRIALIVRSLDVGGAERQLLAAAKGLATLGFEVHVLTFYDKPVFLPLENSTGVVYWSADKRGRWDMPAFALRMVRKLRRIRPHVVYSSMPAANILASVLRKLIGEPRIAWRLASSDMDLSRYDWFTRMSYRVESHLTHVPDAIIANSQMGRRSALDRGYPGKKLTVIANGIDTDVFTRDSDKGRQFLHHCGLDGDEWIIGQIARSDPKKDYETFIDAAALLCRRRNDVRFVCVGVDHKGYSETLKVRAHSRGLSDRIIWHGLQMDMLQVYSALDINTLSSAFGEGFSNAVAEAMSCGVPCVVTDIGDSALIVGETGEVITPRSPELLMDAWDRLLNRLERENGALRSAARKRVVENFGLDNYIQRTAALLESLA